MTVPTFTAPTPTASTTPTPTIDGAPLPPGATTDIERVLTERLAALPEDHRCHSAGIVLENASLTPIPTFETVTPVQAARWLAESNVHNRRYSNTRTIRAAGDMKSGRWKVTGEAIKFDWFGHQLDGQHRLGGIVASGVEQIVLVVRGLDPASQEVMDSGANRTAGDALSLRGEREGRVLASVVRRVIEWDQGVRDRRYRMSRYSATNGEVIAWLDANPRVREVATQARTLHDAPMPVSIRGLLWVVFDRIDPDQAAEFFARLNDGAGLEHGDPILTLRNKLTVLRAKQDARPLESSYIDMTVRAWNQWRKGNKLYKLAANTGKTNMIPAPK